MMPSATACDSPRGCPIASTSWPTRRASESPSGAAGSPLASTRSAARSTPGSRATRRAVSRRPSANTTSAPSPRTTCALVTISPSSCQMTPAPPPCPGVITPTTLSRSRAATSATAPESASSPGGTIVSIAMSVSLCVLPARPLLALADSHGHTPQLAAAHHARRLLGANPLRPEQAEKVVRVAHRRAREADQNVADKQPRLVCRALLLGRQDQQPTLLAQRQPLRELRRQPHRLRAHAQEAAADAPL